MPKKIKESSKKYDPFYPLTIYFMETWVIMNSHPHIDAQYNSQNILSSYVLKAKTFLCVWDNYIKTSSKALLEIGVSFHGQMWKHFSSWEYLVPL